MKYLCRNEMKMRRINRWRSKTVTDAFAPIIYLNSIFGLGMCEFPLGRTWPVLSVILSSFRLSTYFAIAYLRIYLYPAYPLSESPVYMSVLILNAFVALSCIILGWRNAKSFRMILRKFTQIDETLERLGVERNTWKVFCKARLCICLWTLGMIVLCSIQSTTGAIIYEPLMVFLESLTFYVPILVNCVVDITVSSLVWCLEFYFKRTNDFIDETIVRPALKVSKNFRVSSSNKHLLEVAKQVHLELRRLSKYISSTFGIQIVFELAVHLALITGALYNLYLTLEQSFSGEEERLTILSMVAWSFAYSGKLAAINYLCSDTATESMRTAKLLQEFEHLYLDKEIKAEVKQFCFELILNPVHFTAYGFISLCNNCTRSFFATVSKYLIILIQMSD